MRPGRLFRALTEAAVLLAPVKHGEPEPLVGRRSRLPGLRDAAR